MQHDASDATARCQCWRSSPDLCFGCGLEGLGMVSEGPETSRNVLKPCGYGSKLGTPKLWMVNTKLDIHICGPLGLPFWPTSMSWRLQGLVLSVKCVLAYFGAPRRRERPWAMWASCAMMCWLCGQAWSPKCCVPWASCSWVGVPDAFHNFLRQNMAEACVFLSKQI